MFKIKNNTIYLTRGDIAIIPFQIPINADKTEFYQFRQGDKVTFSVYEEDGYDKCPLIRKKVIVEDLETDMINIKLDSSETKIGTIENDIVEYWFEITLNQVDTINQEQTVLGYDDEYGAKILYLLPEGSDIEC